MHVRLEADFRYVSLTETCLGLKTGLSGACLGQAASCWLGLPFANTAEDTPQQEIPGKLCMAQRLWSRRRNPPRSVAARLGISEWDFSNALHKIKEAAGLGGADRVIIWSDGTVTEEGGDVIGNVYDEL